MSLKTTSFICFLILICCFLGVKSVPPTDDVQLNILWCQSNRACDSAQKNLQVIAQIPNLPESDRINYNKLHKELITSIENVARLTPVKRLSPEGLEAERKHLSTIERINEELLNIRNRNFINMVQKKQQKDQTPQQQYNVQQITQQQQNLIKHDQQYQYVNQQLNQQHNVQPQQFNQQQIYAQQQQQQQQLPQQSNQYSQQQYNQHQQPIQQQYQYNQQQQHNQYQYPTQQQYQYTQQQYNQYLQYMQQQQYTQQQQRMGGNNKINKLL